MGYLKYYKDILLHQNVERVYSEGSKHPPSVSLNVCLSLDLCLMWQLDAPVVTQAFLKHDLETLRDHCGSEIMQRLEGLCKAFQEKVGMDERGCHEACHKGLHMSGVGLVFYHALPVPLDE